MRITVVGYGPGSICSAEFFFIYFGALAPKFKFDWECKCGILIYVNHHLPQPAGERTCDQTSHLPDPAAAGTSQPAGTVETAQPALFS